VEPESADVDEATDPESSSLSLHGAKLKGSWVLVSYARLWAVQALRRGS